MAELVANCPRCGAKHVTFDVLAEAELGIRDSWQNRFEVFGRCRRCVRATIFIIALEDPSYRQHLNAGGGKPSRINGLTLDSLFVVEGYVSVLDMGSDQPPEHLPADVEKVYAEAVKCLAIKCPNAAGTMFRMCLDIATRSLLPNLEEADGPNSKQRRDLGLRLPWLINNGRLPAELRDLASCIKEDGNDGAHAGTLSMHDIEDMRDFTFRLLDRLYSEPARLKLAAARRDARRGGTPPTK